MIAILETATIGTLLIGMAHSVVLGTYLYIVINR